MIINELERSWKFFRNERYYDQAIQIKRFVVSFFKKKQSYGDLHHHLMSLAELYKEKQEIGQNERKMYYYLVTFIGKKRKENDGVSSVSRSFEHLKQCTESMKQQYESLTNEQVTNVTMNGQNRERSSNDLLIEVINHHQQSTGVRGRQFVCENRDETYCNDKSNEIEQCGKRF